MPRRRARPASPDFRICEILLNHGANGLTQSDLHAYYGVDEITAASLASHLHSLFKRMHIYKLRAKGGNVFTLTSHGIKSIDISAAARAKMEHARQFKTSFLLESDPAHVVRISRDHLRLIVDRALEAPLPLNQAMLDALAAASKQAA